MPGDYTRKTFDPLDDHIGVLMQQGRVTLDADFNELVALLDRQLRVRTLDTIGRCAVPRETMDGFRIQLAGGSFTIGRGRAYVHGLLAENHGSGDLEWDRILAEQRGTEPTPYEKQPYLPSPPPLLPGGIEQRLAQLVYLDVWERELTHVEDPDLVEKAVGVDTATRLQTVWQVKVLPVPRGTTCATPDEAIPGWLELTRPSGGRLSTQAVGVPASDDPCILDPAGGFRGTENRLYRVEVHEPGDLGKATFKWSRDNASIATRVRAIDAGLDTLTVASLGRDGVRRFTPQDWVEVIDDRLELAGEPGVLRKVLTVDEVAETLTLESALPAGVFDATDPQKLNTRVRRWDQKGQVLNAANAVVADVDANNGAIPVSAGGGTMVLEDGVEVTFSLATQPGLDAFRTGDAWVFAARTIDASVEELQEAPPRAIHHHYCRLAVIVGRDQVIDCRTFWPPEFGERGCDCTECVSADEHNSGIFTIQMALDRVRATGGKVCLGPGVFNLGTQPVELHGMASVQLQGHGFGTLLFYAGSGPAVSVFNSSGIDLERFAVAALLGTDQPALALGIISSQLVHVERCALLQIGGRDRGAPAVGLSGVLIEVALRDNLILGRDGIQAITAAPDLTPSTVLKDPRSFLATFGLEISDNLIVGAGYAVDLGRLALHLGENRIADNQLVGGQAAAFLARGFVPLQGLPSRLELRGNVVTTNGHGIAVGTHQARISDNDVGVLGTPPLTGEEGRHGIFLTTGLLPAPLEGAQVLGNRVTGLSGDGVHIATAVGSAMIKQNVLRALGGGGIVMADGSDARALTIENNQLFDVGTRDAKSARLAAIRAQRTTQLEITSNSVRGFGETSPTAQLRSAIEVGASESVRIVGNDLQRLGPESPGSGTTVGILVAGPFDALQIHDNGVQRGYPATDVGGLRWIGIAVTGLLGRTGANTDLTTQQPDTTASLFEKARFVVLGAERVAFLDALIAVILRAGTQSIAVRGNFVDGAGVDSLIRVAGRASVTLTENRVVAAASPDGSQPTVLVAGRDVIAGSNSVLRVPSDDARDAIQLVVSPERTTVLGNIATGGHIRIGAAPLPDPWRPLNVISF